MDWRDGEACGSLSTIREARVDRVRSQEGRACRLLSHGEEAGRDADEVREAPCPVSLERKTSASLQAKRKMIKERPDCQNLEVHAG